MDNKYSNSTYKNNKIISIELTEESKQRVNEALALYDLNYMLVTIVHVHVDIVITTDKDSGTESITLLGWHLDHINNGEFSDGLIDIILCDLQHNRNFIVNKY